MRSHYHYLLHNIFQADIIMALAGSNGGSWSTNYSPKSVRAGGESNMPGRDSETGTAINMALLREFRGRLSATGISNHGVGSGDQISTPSGDPLIYLICCLRCFVHTGAHGCVNSALYCMWTQSIIRK